MNIRLPNITALNDTERIAQINDYLFTLVRELNLALLDIEKGAATVEVRDENKVGNKTADEVFTDLKPFIIKNADIISSYSDAISKNLQGVYVARSEFGTYTEKTDAKIEANSKNITQYYKDVQII